MSTARELYIHNLVCFCTLEGFRFWLVIPVICKNVNSLIATSFSFYVFFIHGKNSHVR
jgi:hypothetical protein